MNTGNRFLDSLKRVLVRFKDAGFGIKFIKNLPKVADYFSDKNVSILGKSKVLLSFIVTLIYFVFAIDVIPEVLFGPIGFLDDIFVIIWMIGIVNEELSKYSGPQDFSSKSNKKVYKDSNIIDDVTYSIKDDN
jgi:uncharacterized membrane protein YkvA (DUF1232 family)